MQGTRSIVQYVVGSTQDRRATEESPMKITTKRGLGSVPLKSCRNSSVAITALSLCACSGNVSSEASSINALPAAAPGAAVPIHLPAAADPGAAVAAPPAINPEIATIPGTAPEVAVPGGNPSQPGNNPSRVPGAPTQTSPVTSACIVPSASHAVIRRLTTTEYSNAVRSLLGVEVDASALAGDILSGPFATNRGEGASSLATTRYQAAAETIAAQAVQDISALTACANLNDACAMEFIGRFARLAFRRALTPEEQASFRDAYDAAKEARDATHAIQTTIEYVLQSPFFLYQVERSEPGNAPAGLEQLTGYSLAEKLASFLWESVPDEALLQAAESGALSTPEGIRTQTQRMLADARSAEAIVSFFRQWFETEGVETIAKDPDQFPEFNDELAEAMAHESEDFVRWMLSANAFTYRELMTSSQAFPGAELASFYGVDAAAPGQAVQLPTEVRYGIMTHPSIMAFHAHTKSTAIVLRGAFIRSRLLCQPLPEPPADVDIELAEPPEGVVLTAREQIDIHRQDPACAACHALIDDLGFAFEHFDAIGQYRTDDNGQTVDATGSLLGVSTAGEFANVRDLIDRVITSEEGIQCAVTQWHRFAQRRQEQASDDCSLERTKQAFVDSGYDFRSLILSTVESDAFRLRDPSAAPQTTPETP